MNNKKIFLTQQGLDELKEEHKALSGVRRPQIVQRVSQARDMGDLSENAEYSAARDELAFVDGRIEELEEIIKNAQIIADSVSGSRSDGVQLGSQVTLKLNGKQEQYRVVGEWEADPGEKKISHASPLGKALMGKKMNETIEVYAPAGKIVYTIISVA